MGLFHTRWEAKHEGVTLTVARNEFTRGYRLECDGCVVASKRWSLVGLGDLYGSIRIGGRQTPVHVELTIPRDCRIQVDGKVILGRRVL
jgi:hypothetical protein